MMVRRLPPSQRLPICSPAETCRIILSQGADIDDDELKGITPRITEQIFDEIIQSSANIEYMVKVSYMEIYMERIRDLLARGSSRFPRASVPGDGRG